ncbi:MAG: hypothetical protein KDC13_04710, partial [Bacteroidetes bacterium]|nr:hypothetical protein [Bacteroidota bacterium]
MKRFYLLFLLFILSFTGLVAQPFGNEWINYDQKYYRFPVYNTGVYRISSASLLEAIPALNAVDPRSLQIFARGEEQAILVQGESDGIWDDGDFVEFFGRKNDGWFDASLYSTPESEQSNPYYSLFTDTASYYITWNNDTSNLRM